MAERKLPFVSREMAKALNNIDVVFADCPVVKALWHKYYNLLSQQPSEDRVHTWLELLAAMATNVGNRNLSQVDLDKFYVPQGHMDEADFQRRVGAQWLRVLENTERLLVEPKANREA